MGVPGYNRKLISLEQAIKTVIKDLNQKGVEQATGKSVSWFRKCSDPQDTERQIIHNGKCFTCPKYSYPEKGSSKTMCIRDKCSFSRAKTAQFFSHC